MELKVIVLGVQIVQTVQLFTFGELVQNVKKESRVELRISDCETGSPPEGWESVGQLRIWKYIESRIQEIRTIFTSILLNEYLVLPPTLRPAGPLLQLAFVCG
jgi:hypothetical protein